MIEKLEKRTMEGDYDGQIDGEHYVYRYIDGSISCISVVESPATSCEQCGINDVRNKGSIYACNRCGHRGDHGIWLVPVDALPQDGEAVTRRGHIVVLKDRE